MPNIVPSQSGWLRTTDPANHAITADAVMDCLPPEIRTPEIYQEVAELVSQQQFAVLSQIVEQFAELQQQQQQAMLEQARHYQQTQHQWLQQYRQDTRLSADRQYELLVRAIDALAAQAATPPPAVHVSQTCSGGAGVGMIEAWLFLTMAIITLFSVSHVITRPIQVVPVPTLQQEVSR